MNFGTQTIKWFFLIVYTLISVNSFASNSQIPVAEDLHDEICYTGEVHTLSSHTAQSEQILHVSKGKSQEPVPDTELIFTGLFDNSFCFELQLQATVALNSNRPSSKFSH